MRSVKDLAFGKTLGAGAFGTVRQATTLLDGVTTNVAVKTLAFTEQDEYEEKLEEFTQEATVGWGLSSRSRNAVWSSIPLPTPAPPAWSCLNDNILSRLLHVLHHRKSHGCAKRSVSRTTLVTRGYNCT